MKRRMFGLFATMGVVACGGGPAPAVEAPAPPPAPSTAPPPVASASSSAAAETPAPAPTKEQSPFHLLAKSESQLELFPLGDKLFVRGGTIRLAAVEGDRVIEDERFGKGLEGYIGLRGLLGKWPDDAWAAVTLTNGRVGWGGIRKWNGRSWAATGTDLGQRWIFADVSQWSGGLLALAFNVMPYDTKEPVRFKLVGPGTGAKLPVPTKAACGTLVKASGFAALPSGEVFAAGATCDDDKLAVEHWKAGETKGRVERLNGVDPYNEVYVLPRTPTDVWVIGDAWKSSTTAHYDGERWEVVKNSFDMPVISASLGGDGTLWVITSHTSDPKRNRGALWKRAPKKDWEKVALPEGAKVPISVYAASDGVVWLTAEPGLYRSKPPKGEVQTVKWDYDQQFPGSVRIPKAATEGCKDIFVLMYGITKVTPKDYDFPLTRKAIKGHSDLAGARFAETEDNGKRYFGAFVPTLAMGKKIEKLVREKVKGSQPAVLCYAPKVVREIAIDLATGDVRN